MKINKYGKVEITPDDILITGFEYDGQGQGSQDNAATTILTWAIKQLEKERRRQRWVLSLGYPRR